MTKSWWQPCCSRCFLVGPSNARFWMGSGGHINVRGLEK